MTPAHALAGAARAAALDPTVLLVALQGAVRPSFDATITARPGAT